tara:strand:- start:81 stop:584 length:504 start_codon:yes stop_codon:yes gene_type:complete
MDVHVFPSGKLKFGDLEFRCAIGYRGVRNDKYEDDGATPIGCFEFRRVLYRAERLDRPVTQLPITPIRRFDGWCDDPKAPEYNCNIRLPFHASHEELWREDDLYNVIVVLGHNDRPPVPGLGSAIFLHVAKPDYSATDGCIALPQTDLVAILSRCDFKNKLRVMPSN